MRTTRRIAFAGMMTILALSATLTGGAADKTTAGPKPVADSKLGLAPGSVFDTLTPDPVTPDTADPGTKPVLPRWSAVAPPMIPHGIADFVPITKDSNGCLDCHSLGKAEKGEPTAVPASHAAPVKEGESPKVSGARWICISCHVPLTGAKPLPATTRK